MVSEKKEAYKITHTKCQNQVKTSIHMKIDTQEKKKDRNLQLNANSDGI